MKVLVVCSYNAGQVSPFILEQVESLRKSGITLDYFLIKGKGIRGYLANFRVMKGKIHEFKPDLIHAHYGLSGLLANLQRKVPVITTFHGSDINISWVRPFSILASFLSKRSIFVAEGLTRKIWLKGNFSIISSGTDLDIFYPINKSEARTRLNLPQTEKLVLFAGSFSNRIKNYPLAESAIHLLKDSKLAELKEFSRQEVNLMLNACDVALMTSFHEGSPQFIKEAMACNRPIVSTDVGDVKTVIGDTIGCFIAEAKNVDIANKLKHAMNFQDTTYGRNRITELGLDLETITGKILKLYINALN